MFSYDSDKAKKKLDAFYTWLTTPVHASSLSIFRVVYAYVMLAQILKWADMFDEFQESVYTLHYPGVWWIKPVWPTTGNMMLLLCFLSSVSLAAGFMTRAASVMNYLMFSYVFHICHSNYNNHYVLMCHINFVGCFVNWGTWGSIDALIRTKQRVRVEHTVPRWHLWLMQLLFCVPYFWGGVAKMNSDWLFRAQPLIDWFGGRKGILYQQWWFPWFIAWSGMLYDLSISFLLLWRRTRFLLGFPGAVFFNIGNRLMFNIGVFPFAMIASLVLFLDPDHPAKLIRLALQSPYASVESKEIKSIPADSDKDEEKYAVRRQKKWHKWYVLVYVCGFLFFHVAYPLRHFAFYKSNPSWTEEGHTGAWHMKLRSKTGWVYLECIEQDNRTTKIAPHFDRFINRSQTKKIEPRPEDMLTYVGRIKQLFDEANRPLKAIHVHSCFSLNSNPKKRLYMESVNMLNHIGKYEWIGTTAVDSYIYTFEEAPPCHESNPYRQREKTEEFEDNIQYTVSHVRSPTAFCRELYQDAHIYSGKQLGIRGRGRHHVFHIDGDLEDPGKLQPAYTWNV